MDWHKPVLGVFLGHLCFTRPGGYVRQPAMIPMYTRVGLPAVRLQPNGSCPSTARHILENLRQPESQERILSIQWNAECPTCIVIVLLLYSVMLHFSMAICPGGIAGGSFNLRFLRACVLLCGCGAYPTLLRCFTVQVGLCMVV